jgi:hypothetical protein
MSALTCSLFTARILQMISMSFSFTGVTAVDSWNRIPAEVLKNQSKVPQFGQGASPGGWDGSMQIRVPQIGQ